MIVRKDIDVNAPLTKEQKNMVKRLNLSEKVIHLF